MNYYWEIESCVDAPTKKMLRWYIAILMIAALSPEVAGQGAGKVTCKAVGDSR